MAKESAEEKLLKMMQKSAPSVAGSKTSPSSLPKKKLKLSFSITALNILLFLGIIICIVLLVLEIRSGFSLLNQPVSFSPESKADTSMPSDSSLSAPSADYYLQSINERNIFRPYVPKAAAKPAAAGLDVEMAKYKLVGISWLDLPETASVMIEDKTSHKTFFLMQGEQLEGGVTVKTIYTDRVVFSHENEETTIKL